MECIFFECDEECHCVCCQAKAAKQEQEISRLLSEVSQLVDVRTQHETSIQRLQQSMSQASQDHESKRDQASHTIHALTSELRTTKQALEDVTKREHQVDSVFRCHSLL